MGIGMCHIRIPQTHVKMLWMCLEFDEVGIVTNQLIVRTVITQSTYKTLVIVIIVNIYLIVLVVNFVLAV